MEPCRSCQVQSFECLGHSLGEASAVQSKNHQERLYEDEAIQRCARFYSAIVHFLMDQAPRSNSNNSPPKGPKNAEIAQLHCLRSSVTRIEGRNMNRH